MKQLTCRKCEGHGIVVALKGHAPACPYNACSCERCCAVMHLRASALVRRFRHRAPSETKAVISTIRSKNGNVRMRISRNHPPNPAHTDVREVVYECRRPLSTCSSESSSLSITPTSTSPSPLHVPPINAHLANVVSAFLNQSAFSLTPSSQQYLHPIHPSGNLLIGSLAQLFI